MPTKGQNDIFSGDLYLRNTQKKLLISLNHHKTYLFEQEILSHLN